MLAQQTRSIDKHIAPVVQESKSSLQEKHLAMLKEIVFVQETPAYLNFEDAAKSVWGLFLIEQAN